MTRKLIDTDTIGKSGKNLGEINRDSEYQAETDMGTDLLLNNISFWLGTWLSQKTRSLSLTRIHKTWEDRAVLPCVTLISATEGISTKDSLLMSVNRSFIMPTLSRSHMTCEKSRKRALYRTVGSVLKQETFFETPKKRANTTDPTPEIGCLLILMELNGQLVGHVGAATYSDRSPGRSFHSL